MTNLRPAQIKRSWHTVMGTRARSEHVYNVLETVAGAVAKGPVEKVLCPAEDEFAIERDCFVAPLLAMTYRGWSLRAKRSNPEQFALSSPTAGFSTSPKAPAHGSRSLVKGTRRVVNK